MRIYFKLVEKLPNLDGLISEGVKYLEDLLHLPPALSLENTLPEHLLHVVVVVVLDGPVVEQEEVHELLLGEPVGVLVSAVAENIPKRVGVNVVDPVEERAFLEKVLDGVERYRPILGVEYVPVDVLNDLLLLNFERISPVLPPFGKLNLLLEELAVLLHHVFQPSEPCRRS